MPFHGKSHGKSHGGFSKKPAGPIEVSETGAELVNTIAEHSNAMTMRTAKALVQQTAGLEIGMKKVYTTACWLDTKALDAASDKEAEYARQMEINRAVSTATHKHITNISLQASQAALQQAQEVGMARVTGKSTVSQSKLSLLMNIKRDPVL